MLRQTLLQRTKSSRDMLHRLQNSGSEHKSSRYRCIHGRRVDIQRVRLTVKEALAHQIAIIGENMNIRRFAQVTEEERFRSFLYTHAAVRSVFWLTLRQTL